MERGAGYYPEGCDGDGGDCSECVRRTGESLKALTASPTAEWASGVFQGMYKYAACRQMEHMFVFACGVELTQIETVAA